MQPCATQGCAQCAVPVPGDHLYCRTSQGPEFEPRPGPTHAARPNSQTVLTLTCNLKANIKKYLKFHQPDWNLSCTLGTQAIHGDRERFPLIIAIPLKYTVHASYPPRKCI